MEIVEFSLLQSIYIQEFYWMITSYYNTEQFVQYVAYLQIHVLDYMLCECSHWNVKLNVNYFYYMTAYYTKIKMICQSINWFCKASNKL